MFLLAFSFGDSLFSFDSESERGVDEPIQRGSTDYTTGLIEFSSDRAKLFEKELLRRPVALGASAIKVLLDKLLFELTRR
jgi:hypothetical protein